MTRSFSYGAWLKSQTGATRKSPLNPEKKKKKRDRGIDEASDGKTRRQKRTRNLNLSLFFLKKKKVSLGAVNRLRRRSRSASVSRICQQESVLHLHIAPQSQPCLPARHFELSRRLSWPTPICRPSISSDLLASKRRDSPPAALANSPWAELVGNLPWFSVLRLKHAELRQLGTKVAKSLSFLSRRSSAS